MKSFYFFANRSVFTHAEFTEFLNAHEPCSVKAREALITRHVKAGHIVRVKVGLYISVPYGSNPDTCPVDPFLVAAKMSDDAVLAYQSALGFHTGYQPGNGLYPYLSDRMVRPVIFRDDRFRRYRFLKVLKDKGEELFSVGTIERAGIRIRVTGLDRTIVDLLDRPSIGGGLEEVWRSLESLESLDVDKTVYYALLLENSTTIAKVGFYLEQRKKELGVEDHHLERLRKHRPRLVHYMNRNGRGRKTKPSRFVKEWNLMVPIDILDRLSLGTK